MSIQERIYSADEYADARDEITELKAENDTLKQAGADAASDAVGSHKACDRLGEEVERLKRELAELAGSTTYRCIHCGVRSQSEEALREHCRTCPKHPARLEIERLKAIITKLSHRLGCLRKRRKRELAQYQKFLGLLALGRTDGGKALVEGRLAEIEDKLYRLFASLRGGPIMVRCVHCGACFTDPLPDTHWRTCPKHPAGLEVERLTKQLAERKKP